jgi:hypothetical protein
MRRLFSNWFFLPLIFLTFQPGADLRGQETNEQTGTDVSVERLSGQIIEGELMVVGKDAFVVKSASQDSLVLRWSDVKRISGGTNGRPGLWFAIGAVAGVVTGVIIGKPEETTSTSYSYNYSTGTYDYINTASEGPDNRAKDACILGGAGGLVFGLIAAACDNDFEYDVQSMRSDELLAAKDALRGRAHYPDADAKAFAIAPVKKNTPTPRTETPQPRSAIDIELDIPEASSSNPNAIAVVIGNSHYLKSDVPAVDFAAKDARLMREYLIKMFGYREGNIIFIEDATQADFNAVFGTDLNYKGKLYNYVKEGKSDVFIYYNGHGAPNPESKEGFFVPVDCEPSLVSLNGYALRTFYNNLSKVRYKSLTVVIDACFSGSSEKGMLLKNLSPIFIEVEDPALKLKNAVVMTSAAGNQVSSWYPEKEHSLFTFYLLRGIRGEADEANGKTITAGRLKDYLLENVRYMARRLSNREQTPQVYGKRDWLIMNVP